MLLYFFIFFTFYFYFHFFLPPLFLTVICYCLFFRRSQIWRTLKVTFITIAFASLQIYSFSFSFSLPQAATVRRRSRALPPYKDRIYDYPSSKSIFQNVFAESGRQAGRSCYLIRPYWAGRMLTARGCRLVADRVCPA